MAERPRIRILEDLALAVAVGLIMFLALFGWPAANKLFGPIGWVWLVLVLLLVACLPLAGIFADGRPRSAHT